jgi:hypothetical protein
MRAQTFLFYDCDGIRGLCVARAGALVLRQSESLAPKLSCDNPTLTRGMLTMPA